MWNLIWQGGIVNPMTNLLLVLYNFLGNNFFLALVVFTAFTRIIMLPLSLRQQRSMARTQEIQPQIQAIQKKYRNDPQKMQEEFKRIGYNPTESLTGCLPLLIQMPIFFGLYRAITYVLATTPQSLYELSERAYDSVNLTNLLPIENTFAWMNLAQPDPLFILPLLVGGTMFLQQKLLAPPKREKKKGSAPDPAAQMQQSMQVTMPLMFGFFALSFPAGLSIYFVISNIIGMAQGWYLKRTREAAASQQSAKKKPVVIDQEPMDQPAKTQKAEKTASKSKSKKQAKREQPDLFQQSIRSSKESPNGTAKRGKKKK